MPFDHDTASLANESIIEMQPAAAAVTEVHHEHSPEAKPTQKTHRKQSPNVNIPPEKKKKMFARFAFARPEFIPTKMSGARMCALLCTVSCVLIGAVLLGVGGLVYNYWTKGYFTCGCGGIGLTSKPWPCDASIVQGFKYFPGSDFTPVEHGLEADAKCFMPLMACVADCYGMTPELPAKQIDYPCTLLPVATREEVGPACRHAWSNTPPILVNPCAWDDGYQATTTHGPGFYTWTEHSQNDGPDLNVRYPCPQYKDLRPKILPHYQDYYVVFFATGLVFTLLPVLSIIMIIVIRCRRRGAGDKFKVLVLEAMGDNAPKKVKGYGHIPGSDDEDQLVFEADGPSEIPLKEA